MIDGKAETGSLLTGGLAGVLASACCAGPLILLSVGVSGAWISYLTLLEPYRWIFIASGAAALIFAWRRIYRPAAPCAAGAACTIPPIRRGYRIAFWTVSAFVAASAAFPYAAPYLL